MFSAWELTLIYFLQDALRKEALLPLRRYLYFSFTLRSAFSRFCTCENVAHFTRRSQSLLSKWPPHYQVRARLPPAFPTSHRRSLWRIWRTNGCRSRQSKWSRTKQTRAEPDYIAEEYMCSSSAPVAFPPLARKVVRDYSCNSSEWCNNDMITGISFVPQITALLGRHKMFFTWACLSGSCENHHKGHTLLEIMQVCFVELQPHIPLWWSRQTRAWIT